MHYQQFALAAAAIPIPLPPAAAIYKPRSSTPSGTTKTYTSVHKIEHLAVVAMEAAAAPRPRLTLIVLAAALLVLAHGGAVTPRAVALGGPARAVAAAGGPAASVVVAARRPWVARLQALHDLSTSLDSGAGGEQQQGGFAECWGAVMGLSSCYSEILLFFVNGESYIGPDCCVAIRGATRYCWPAMLASVGFTAEEADVLRGFCDGEEAAHQLGSTPPPVPAPGRGAGQL